jgi:hypothetical protein
MQTLRIAIIALAEAQLNGWTMTSTSAIAREPDLQASAAGAPQGPAKHVGDYKIGGLDKRGRKVLDILWSTNDFVIFQHAGGISPHFSDDDDLSREQARRYMSLGPALSRINALLPPPEQASGEARFGSRGWSFFHTPNAFLYRETARAIANALTGEHERAMEILAFVEARMMARRRAQGQFQYLLACTGTLAAIALVALAFEFLLPLPAGAWPDLARVAACGAAGGFLSVALGIRKLDIDPDTRWWVNSYYGLIRLTIAIVSAVILYFLVKGKLVLQPLFPEASAHEMFALYALAVAAGFSETFIPNILRRAEEGAASREGEGLPGGKKKDGIDSGEAPKS